MNKKRLYFASLNDCNEDCLFCVRGGDEPPIKYIDTEQAKVILKQKKKQGYQDVYFDGGEPTLRKDLLQLIKFVRQVGYEKANILTNGVLLSNEKLVKKLLSVKQDKGFSLSFSVSLHSHKKDISEKLVDRKNTFKKTIKGIKNLLKNNCAHLSIYHIITKYNYCDLPDFVNYINTNFPKIKNITFSFVYLTGAVLKNKHILPQLSKTKKYFRKALELCKKYEINYSITTCGTIPLCFLKGYEKLLIKQQELDQPDKVGLIDSKQDAGYQLATRKFHNKTKIKIPECNNCIYNNKCGGIWRDYVEMYGTGELEPVIDKANKKNKQPNVLLLLTGFSCNNNCIFCSNVASRDFNSSKQEIFEKIENGYQQGFGVLEFIGGEVTIRPDFLELIKYAKKVGFNDVRLTTNGRLFSYPEFTEKAWKAGLRVIVVSLYGHNKKLHDGATRTSGSFDQCLEGIKNINNLTDIYLVINTVVSKINYKYLPEIGNFVSKLKAKEWHPLELLPDGRGAEKYNILSVAYKELAPYINKAAALAGNKIPQIDFFDFPFCIFDKKYLNKSEINFITPQIRLDDIEMQGHDKSSRVKKIKEEGQIVYQDKYKIKPKFCKKCIYYSQCGGLAKPYYEKYQDKEIMALAQKSNLISN